MHPSSDTDYPDIVLGSDDIRDLDAGPSTRRTNTATNSANNDRNAGRGQPLDQIDLSMGATYERPTSGMAGRERRAGATPGIGAGAGAGAGPSSSTRVRDELPSELDYAALGRAAAESGIQAEEEEITTEPRRPTSRIPRKVLPSRESMERSRRDAAEARGQAVRNALAHDPVPTSRLPRRITPSSECRDGSYS